MRIPRFCHVAAFMALALLAAGARGASISYVLDQTDADPFLRDGQPYLQVTVADGAAGAIDFTVSMLPSLAGIADADFSLRGFMFDTQGAADALLPANIVGLPAGWSLASGSPGGDFGSFDVMLDGASAIPIGAELTFSIAGVDNDSVGDYVVLSGGKAVEGHVYFAGRVAGFQDRHPGIKELTGAWFGGGSQATTVEVVPLPGVGWLFLSAVASLGVLRRQSLR